VGTQAGLCWAILGSRIDCILPVAGCGLLPKCQEKTLQFMAGLVRISGVCTQREFAKFIFPLIQRICVVLKL
jgi:hypothetical protein